jgi:hypothetical protein
MRGRAKIKGRRSVPLRRVCIVAGIVLAAATPYSAAGNSGPAVPGSPSGNPFDRGIVAPSAVLTGDPATSRVARDVPRVTGPPMPAGAFINRPTVPLDQYKAAQLQNARAARRPGGTRTPAAPATLTNGGGFLGITQATAQDTWPPDINGAVSTGTGGAGQNATVVNSHITVWTKSTTPSQLMDLSLASYFGYTNQSIFDPRILYDRFWNRWIVSAEAFPESSSVQCFQLGLTTGPDLTGAFFNYNCINAVQLCGTGNFFDYPQIGYTQDAVIVTGNCFGAAGYLGSKAIAIAKAILYNGGGFSTPVFTFTDGTITPPIVLDQNYRAHLIARNGPHDETFWSPQSGFYSQFTSNNVITGFFTPSVPRSAGQLGCTVTSCLIDTGDGRFVAPSIQVGQNLWNVATYGLSGSGSFATPTWGQFDVEPPSMDTTIQAGQRFLDACSDDFNASIAAQSDGRAVMNWTSTDPNGSACGGTFVRQVVAGRLPADAAGTMPSLLQPYTSSFELTGNFDPNFGVQRWGDTSSTSLDPSSFITFWTWNESVASNSLWGTRAQKIFNN